MRNEVKRKVWAEIFFAPSVIVTAVAGATALLFSWAVNGNTFLTLSGIGAILGSLGWLATRAIFGVEKITAQVIEKIKAKQRQAEEDELDSLHQKLLVDRDHRTQDFLTMLRTVRSEFEKTVMQPGVELRSQDIVNQVRQLFGAAVAQLKQSYKLYGLSERLVGDHRERILQQRESVLVEIDESIQHLQSVTDQYTRMIERDQKIDLTNLRDELDTSLEVAKRTEERMRELDISNNYESYLKE